MTRETKEVGDPLVSSMPPRARPAADIRRAGREEPPVRGGRILRRPAAHVDAGEDDRGRGREEEEVAREPRLAEGFERGEKLRCQDIPLEGLRRGVAVAIEGSYWGANASVAGLLQDIHVRGPADVEVSLKLQGTNEENLLRWSTGNPTELLRVHLCGGACPDRLEADNLLHGVSICKRVTEDLPWMSNLVDALEPGRRPAEAGLLSGEAKEKEEGGRRKEVERGRSKKREKGEKRKRRSEERGRSRGRPKEKISLRGGAKKKLEDVLGGTGLSPIRSFARSLPARPRGESRRRRDRLPAAAQAAAAAPTAGSHQKYLQRNTKSAASPRGHLAS